MVVFCTCSRLPFFSSQVQFSYLPLLVFSGSMYEPVLRYRIAWIHPSEGVHPIEGVPEREGSSK